MCPQQCVHNVSKVRAVRSLDLRRICSANVNSKSAGHGAGVSFPVQIQPGDAGQGWTGSSPQLGSYLLSVGAAAALCNSIHSSTARRVQHCVHHKQQHHCAPCYAVPCASNVSLVNSTIVRLNLVKIRFSQNTFLIIFFTGRTFIMVKCILKLVLEI